MASDGTDEDLFFEEDPDKIFDYDPVHIEYPYQVGLGKIYDPILVEREKNEDYFKKEYMLRVTGVGERVFPENILSLAQTRGMEYDPNNINPYSDKYILCDPAFYGSYFGVVVVEIVDGNIRVLYADHFLRRSTQQMIDIILDLRVKYRNVKNILIDAAYSEFIIDIKTWFENSYNEYTHSYQEQIREWASDRFGNKKPWQMGMYVIPVPFNKRLEFTYQLKKAMGNGNYWIHPQFDKLLVAYETAMKPHNANSDNEIDKEHCDGIDILDAQLCLFHRIRAV